MKGKQSDPQIFVIGGEKGGTGKTALATNLAVCMAIKKHDVLLVDADPQRSSARWAERRKKLQKEQGLQVADVHYQELRGDLYMSLFDLRKRYERIIVDVAGADSDELRTSLAAADRLYAPMIPSDCDLATAGDLNAIVGKVKALGNRTLEAWVVFNKVSTHYQNSERELATAELADFKHLSVCPVEISERKLFRDAYRARIGVCEFAQGTGPIGGIKAEQEMWRLHKEITGERSP